MCDKLATCKVEFLLAFCVLGSCAYFFQGGGWNQNAHFATTVALVEKGTYQLQHYRDSTGDLAHSPQGVVSAKPTGTAIAMIPGYLVARVLTGWMDNAGNRNITRAYLTSVLGPGVALTLFAVIMLVTLRRRLDTRDAVLVSLSMTIGTTLYPFSTMTSSTAYVALFALWAYSLLEGARLAAKQLSWPRMLLAGLLAGLPAAFEYQTAVVLLPLGLYALWQLERRWRMCFFLAGVAMAALIPLTHHALVYGDPLHVGYASLVVPGFARDAARGFFGIEGLPTLHRLYDLTLGHTRGYIFVSPFLVATLPGLLRMLRSPTQRCEGLVAGGAAWLMVVVVATLAYWHSGWGITSRYGVLFVVFSAIPLAAIFPAHRRWILAGMILSLMFMLLAVSVTATPPPPGGRPAHLSVVGWLYEQFLAGNVALRNENVLVEQTIGNGSPTWRTSFNLGQAMGLHGQLSVLPFVIFLTACVAGLWRLTGVTQRRDGLVGGSSLLETPQPSDSATTGDL
jgi:hypothetical protein